MQRLKPYDPESKGVVERRNGYFETSFLPGHTFSSPADFNTHLSDWLTTANARVVRTTRAKPADLLSADKAAMLALPPVPPTVGWANRIRLGRDYYVRIEHVPAPPAREVLELIGFCAADPIHRRSRYSLLPDAPSTTGTSSLHRMAGSIATTACAKANWKSASLWKTGRCLTRQCITSDSSTVPAILGMADSHMTRSAHAGPASYRRK
ncbi:hypothetical protein FHU39_003472 [Flexivirga oryzae]|uniref:Integrase catalytic domain-containing protein n=1 Tax=Flexivirga oryzae TaxID=1794944 RepID=A0A839NFH9_9MICO|nr:hypothetical protein [Flexivirga oryzae]